MDLLSESQVKIINDFRERVKQSEKRLHDTFEESVQTMGPSTPGYLPYVGEVSRIDQSKNEMLSQEIMIQDMSQLELNSPPQKQLPTYIFNPTPTNVNEKVKIDTFDPRRSHKTMAAYYTNQEGIKREGATSTTPTKSASAQLGKTSPVNKSSYLSNSGIGYLEDEDQTERKSSAFPQNKSLMQKLNKSSHFDLSKYSSHASSQNLGQKSKKDSKNYASKLEDYLNAQGVDWDQQVENLENDPHYFYHLEDEKRRLKVPSIRYYEDNYISAPPKQTNPLAKSIDTKHKVNGVMRSEGSSLKEGRSVLQNVDRNRDRELERKKTPPRDLKNGRRSFPDLSKEKTEKYSSLNNKREMKTEYSRSYIREASLEDSKDTLSPMQNRIQLDSRQKRSGSRNNERLRSQTPQKRKLESVKMRPLSMKPGKRGKTLHQKKQTLKSHLTPTKVLTTENEYENKRQLAKDLLRKVRLGTIGESDFLNLMEGGMQLSKEFYESLRRLLGK